MNRLILLAAIVVAFYFFFQESNPAEMGLSTTDTQLSDQAVANFMNSFGVPGLSLALSQNGTIIFAKAYGYASRENQIPMDTNHVFRIASISKPITSVMIMGLVEQDLISLDDKVFDEGGILAQDYSTDDPNVKLITLRHLLEHTGGIEWTNDGNDPMFRQPLLDNKELIQWTLDDRKLSSAPGTSYHYSNFGFNILGRVIEKVTALSYQDYFASIMLPHNIIGFSLASNYSSGGNREVEYYSQDSQSPYSFQARRMDAHGGWVASPTTMVKFLNLTDGFDEPADILRPETLREMTTPSINNPNYAKGWNVNSANNWWHMGSLPGSATVAVRASTNLTWAVFVNTRSPQPGFTAELDGLMWQIVGHLGLR